MNPCAQNYRRNSNRRRPRQRRRDWISELCGRRSRVESLEPRLLLALDAAGIRDLVDQFSQSDLVSDFLQPALDEHQHTYQQVGSAVQLQVDKLLEKAPLTTLDTSTNLTIGVSLSAELELGPSAILARFGIPVAELSGGYNFGYSLTDDQWTISRSVELVLLGTSFEAEYSATFDSILDVNSNESVTFALAIGIGKGVAAGADVGQIVRAGSSFGGSRDTTIQIAAEYQTPDFLATVGQATFAEGMADVFIPYYQDRWWQNLIVGAGKFIPIVGLDQLIDVSFPDTPLGILAHSDSVDITVSEGLGVSAEFWAGLGGSLDAAIGNVALGIRAGVALSGGVEATIAGPIALPGWRPRDARPLSVGELGRQLQELRIQPTGITIITGGQAADDSGGDAMHPLAQAIHDRVGGWLLDYDLPADEAVGGFDTRLAGAHPAEMITSSILPNASDFGKSGEIVLLFDWTPEANEAVPGWAEAAGDSLYGALISLGFVGPAAGQDQAIPLHFIGHDSGAVVTSEAVRRLAGDGVPVDHVTYLDPHDFHQQLDQHEAQELWTLGQPAGYGVTVWDNVAFADAYYQGRGLNGVREGRPIPGAYNRLLDTELPPADPGNPTNDHDYVWSCFYLATVTQLIPPAASCKPPAGPVGYNQTGFAFSRQAAGQRPDPVLYVDQNQEHTEPAVAEALPGAEQDFYTETKWPSEIDPFSIVNGDFEQPGNRLFANIDPGWSHHGGGGTGAIRAAGDNHFLDLQPGEFCRAHNPVYVPPVITDDFFLSFDLQRSASSNDTLQVRLGGGCSVDALGPSIGAVIAEFSLADTDDAFVSKLAPIPQELRGRALSFVFELSPNGALDGGVRLDKVRFFAPASGGTGDIIRVDLPTHGAQIEQIDFVRGAFSTLDFELATDSTPLDVQFDNNDLILSQTFVVDGQTRQEVLGRVILTDRVEGESFQSLRRFYFAPSTEGMLFDENSLEAGFQGVIVALVKIDGVTYRVPINVDSKFSGSGQNAVTGAETTLDHLRIQQRLRLLGFPDFEGGPLQLDGVIGPGTQHAIGLFNAAVNALGHNHTPSSSIDRSWINEANAPRWVELSPTAGVEIAGGLDQTERWATSWARDLLVAVGSSWDAASITPHTDLSMNGASLVQGGDTPFHVSHEAGMDLDFDTPSTNDLFDDSGNLRVPFFAVVEQPGTNTPYVAAKAGGVLVANGAGAYEPADPNAPGFDWDNALRAEDVWDNEEILDQLRDPNLMASPASYDLDLVRGQIAAFSQYTRAVTASGVTVESILYNDPRTWDLPGVRFFPNHGGHFHVNVGSSLISAEEGRRIVTGLKAVAQRIDEVSRLGPAAEVVSLVGLDTGDAVGAGDLIAKSLADKAEDYFTTDDTPTSMELMEALEGSSSQTGLLGAGGRSGKTSVDVQSDEEALPKSVNDLLLPLIVDARRITRQLPLELGATADDLGLQWDTSATIEATGRLNYSFTIGLDRTPGLDIEDAVFVQVQQMRLGLTIDAADLDISGKLGFLDVGVENGSLQLDASVNIEFQQSPLTLAELRDTPISSLATLHAQPAPLHASLPLAIGIGGPVPCGSPIIAVDDADIFGGAPPVVSATDFDDLLNFNNITPQVVWSMLEQLNGWFSDFGDTSVFDEEIPFSGGYLVGDAIDLPRVFSDTSRGRLTTFYGEPRFADTRELFERLAQAYGLQPDAIQPSYDCSTGDWTFHVRVHQRLENVAVGVDFAVHAGTLAAVSTTSLVNLGAELDLQYEIGVGLVSPLNVNALPANVYVRDASLNGMVSLVASDIEASAVLAGLNVHVSDGSLTAMASIAVSLQDPGTQAPDGRITLQELIDGLQQIETVVNTPQLNVAGNFSLPVTADPFLLGDVMLSLLGSITGTVEDIDYSLAAEIAGTIVSGVDVEPLPSGESSFVTFSQAGGLEIHARANVFGAHVDLEGEIQATDDFSLAATAEPFDIGGVTVVLAGTLSRQASQFDWRLTGAVTNWQPVPFLTVDSLAVSLAPDGIEFETTTTIAGVDGVHLVGDFRFDNSTYLLMADAPREWTPISQVHLSEVRFSVTNRNTDDSPGPVRVTAAADLRLLDTDFLVAAQVTARGQWLAATPDIADWNPVPIPGFSIDQPYLVGSTYDFVLELPVLTEVAVPPSPLAADQRQIVAGVNLMGSGILPASIPGVGGSAVQIAGLLPADLDLARLSIEARLVLDDVEIAGLLALDAVGLRITGAPSIAVFGEGRVLHDQIPRLDQDIAVELALTIDIPGTTLSGSLSLLSPVENLFGVEGLKVIEGDGEFGVNFATTPIPLPTVGFNLLVELPEDAHSTLGLPSEIAAALNISTTQPILAMSVLDWRPFQLLGLDDIVVDQASLVVAPNGGAIGAKIFPRGFSAAFDAEFFGTDVGFVGVFDQATRGFILKSNVSSSRIAGIDIGGNGCDGVFQDGVDNSTPDLIDPDADNGACFVAMMAAAAPQTNGFTVDFTIDLPGSGGLVDVHGELTGTSLTLDGSITQWTPLPTVELAGQIHAVAGLQTTSLELDFDVSGNILGAVTRIVGSISASPSGFALFATGAIGWAFPGGKPFVDLAAAIDVGKNSPFAIELAADLTLPGARPLDVTLTGEIDSAGVVDISAVVEDWSLTPGLTFDGAIHVLANLSNPQLIVNVDVDANLIGSNLNLTGQLYAGADGFDLDLHGQVHFGGTRVGGVSLDLDVDLEAATVGFTKRFSLAFQGEVELFAGFSMDVTAELAASGGGFVFMAEVGQSISLPDIHVGPLTVELIAMLSGTLSFGTSLDDFDMGIRFDGKACVAVDRLGRVCTPTLSAKLEFDGAQIVFPKIKPEVQYNDLGVPTGVKWKKLKKSAPDPSPPPVTVTARRVRDSSARGVSVLEIRGGSRAEQVEVFRRVCLVTAPCGDNLIVSATNAAGDWVQLFTTPTAGLVLIDVDMGAGNDSFLISGFPVLIPTVLRGGVGRDVIHGGAGPNTIYGGRGTGDEPPNPKPFPRTFVGRDSGDELVGGPGNDLIFGEAGNDVIAGGGGSDLLDGGAGVNIVNGTLDVRGSTRSERLEVSQQPGLSNRLDHVCGFSLFPPCAKEVVVRAGYGVGPLVTLLRTPLENLTAIKVNAFAGNDIVTVASQITLPTVLRGGDGEDAIHGGGGPNAIFGDDGDDQLFGGAGNDAIDCGAGIDSVVSSAGADVIDAASCEREVVGSAGGGSNTGHGDNQPPSLHSISNQSIDEGALLTFTAAATDPGNEATFFGPLPYLKTEDSPLVETDFSYFYLEDFEDGQLNVPGVIASSGAVLSNQPERPDGIVSWWRAEDDAEDSLRVNSGELRNGTSFAAGRVGQAFQFDGANDYVEIPSSPSLEMTGQLTVDAWIQLNTSPERTSFAQTIAAKGVDAEAPLDWAFAVVGPLGAEKLRPHVRLSNGDWYYFDCNTTTAAGLWHHVAMTYDGARLSCYMNGELDGSISVAGAMLSSSGPLRIGAYAPVNGSFSKHFFHGLIDELAVYDRALTAEEVRTIAGGGPATQVYANPIYSTRFDAPAGREWSRTTSDATPIGGNRFLGQFGNEAVTLSLGRARGAQLLYQNDFESPHNPPGFVDTTNGDLSQQLVNSLHGSPEFAFQQVNTVETVEIQGGQAFGSGYLDSAGVGGKYSLAMLSTVQDDQLSLTLDAGAFKFLNMQLDVSSIDVDVIGGPFGPSEGSVPVFEFRLYDSPGGAFNIFSPGMLLDSVQALGVASPRHIFEWTKLLASLSAENSTDGHVSLVIDLVSGNYAAFDNLVIAASDTPGEIPAALPPHEAVTLSFDLFVIRTWDGNSNIGGSGPDLFDLSVRDGATLLHTTFNNGYPGIDGFGQAYPASFPGGSNPTRSGAVEINTLGFEFPGVGVMDSVYHLTFTFPHAADSLVLDFSALLTTPGFDESWGLDNVSVSLHESFTAWSAGDDRSFASNPAGPWSFGWTPTRGGEFHLYPNHNALPALGITCCDLDYWNDPDIVDPFNTPSVWRGDSGAYGDRFGAHPGPNGEQSVVRWTAATEGWYEIVATFGVGNSPTIDVAILHDGAQLFSDFVAAGSVDATTYRTLAYLRQGETIDLVVGSGGNGYAGDSTAIDATITLLTPADSLPPDQFPDSVDADDGSIDGSGQAGSSFLVQSTDGVTFTFDPEVLGALPTDAGLVWTDGQPATVVTFEAFDQNGDSLGALDRTVGDASFAGTTAEDRFFGITYTPGVSRIELRSASGGPIEIDHLQYGRFDRQNLVFRLEPGAPAGASIDPTSGVFNWTPTEEQGPAVYTVTVTATDDGVPALSDSETFSITVNEINRPPLLAAVDNQSVEQGKQSRITATATDLDAPANGFTFSLDAGAPPGATIHPQSGVFKWTPGLDQLPGEYFVTVRVTDDGVPALADQWTLTVTVLPDVAAPTIDDLEFITDATGITRLVLAASEALDPATVTSPGQYRLTLLGSDNRLGTADDRVVAIASASYVTSTQVIEITPQESLPRGQLVQLVIETQIGENGPVGISDSLGKVLDGDLNGVSGGDYEIQFVHGARFTFLDRDDDEITLTLAGGGAMDLIQGVSGQPYLLRLKNTVLGESVLSGSLNPSLAGDGLATLDVSGLRRVEDLLDDPPFVLGNAADSEWGFAGAVRRNPKSSGAWDDPDNWSTGVAPGAGDIVIIDRSSVNLVTTVEQAVSAESLTLRDKLVVSGTLTSSLVNLDEGTLSGTGTIVADVRNAGTVRPGRSPGILTIVGDYTQAADGVLEVEIGGATPGADHDQLLVSGAASLNGTLSVAFVNGYVPIDDEFEIISAGERIGEFSAYAGLDLGGGLRLEPVYTAGGLILRTIRDNTPPVVSHVGLNTTRLDPPDRNSGPQPSSWIQQRSDLRSIVVTFSESVTVDASDVRLTNLGINAPVDADLEYNLTNAQLSVDGNVLTIMFACQELPDGVYQLEILPTITDLSGNPLDGNSDGQGGDLFSLVGDSFNRFYKLAFDLNGDRGVSIFDFPAFSYWFGVPTPSAPEYVDVNCDGGVSIFDFPVFVARFGRNVTFPPPSAVSSRNTVPDSPAANPAESARIKMQSPSFTREDQDRGPSPRDLALLELLADWNAEQQAPTRWKHAASPAEAHQGGYDSERSADPLI